MQRFYGLTKEYIKRRKLLLVVVGTFLALGILFFGINRIRASNPPQISNISLDPTLDISYFAPYRALATIVDLPQSETATVDVSGINGQGSEYWNYYTDGSSFSETITKTMSYDSGLDKWKSTSIYPDNIYPEIFFAPSQITWHNAPQNTVVRRNNYQLLHFTNSFTPTANMTFWIEFNAYRKSLANSADLNIYLVEKGHDITYFQSDWRAKAGVEMVGTIERGAAFSHTHTENSSHHLVALSANNNSTFGVKNLDISGDFWVVVYSQSPNDARGWDFRYQSSSLCDNNSTWYSGSQAGWTTAAATGCPDAHVHLARRSSEGGIKDGAKLTVSATNEGETGTETQNLYYNELPNLPPNATTFSHPSVGGTYAGDINITWNAATDPNNDPLLYDLYLLDENGAQVGDPLVESQDQLSYTLQTNIEGSELPDGSYGLKGKVCDNGSPSLCAEYYLDGTFVVDNSSPIKSISSITIASNNATTSLAKAGDQVTLSFVTTGVIPAPTVSIYSGGQDPTNSITTTSADGVNWSSSYVVSESDTSGEISFVVSSPNLDSNYEDTTNGSVVNVDVDDPEASSYVPANGAEKVLIDANLELTFSEDVLAVAGKNIIIKKLSDHSTFETIAANSASVVISQNVVTINKTANFSDKTAYYVLIDSGAFRDAAGNLYSGIQESDVWSFTVGDIVSPTLTDVRIYSNNVDPSVASESNTVTVNFTSDEEINTPTVAVKSGGADVASAVTIENVLANNWTASYTVNAADTNGVVTFTIDFSDLSGNPGVQVAQTSDLSAVTVNKTAPTATTTLTITPTATLTVTATATATKTKTRTVLPSQTATATQSVSATQTQTQTQTAVYSSDLAEKTPTPTPTNAAKDSYGNVILYDVKVYVEKDGKPKGGIRVEFHSGVRSLVTADDGIVTFKDVEGGDHLVKVFDGKKIVQRKINVDGTSETFDVSFKITGKNYLWCYVVIAVLIVSLLSVLILKKPKKIIK